MSRFTKRIGKDNLNKIIDQKAIDLLKSQQTTEVDVLLEPLSLKPGTYVIHPIIRLVFPIMRQFFHPLGAPSSLQKIGCCPVLLDHSKYLLRNVLWQFLCLVSLLSQETL